MPANYEARAVERSETDAMLALMCESFHLDLASAKPVFYSDPFFDLEMKRVLAEPSSGSILSCLTLVPAALRTGPSVVLPVCGMAGVCTQPKMRKTGLASALINTTLDWISRHSHFPLTALTAEQPEIYESLGWHNCAIALDWNISSDLLPHYEEGLKVHELSSDDIPVRAPEIHRCYDQIKGSIQPGTFIRDERRWRCIEKLSVGRRVAIYERSSSVVGYAAYEQRIGESGKTVFIHEITARDQNAQRAMLGYFAAGTLGTTISGRCSHSDATTLGLLALPGVKIESRPNVYMRLTHLTRALSIILSHTPPTSELSRLPEGVAIRIDTQTPEVKEDAASGREGAILKGIGRRVQINPDSERQSLPHWIAGDVGSITQMVIGYKTSAELVSEGKLHTSGTGVRHICDALFPRVEPFLAVPDIF